MAYDGGGELLAGILGGDVEFAATGIGEVAESAAAGEVRILAVTSEEPVEGVDAPTLTDEGVDLVFANWRGIVAPPGLSDDETQKWVDAITEMHDSDAWQQALEDQGWTDAFFTGDEFSSFLDDESKRVEDVHERAGAGVTSAAPGGTREQGRSEYGVALFLGAARPPRHRLRRCCCRRAGSPADRSAPAPCPLVVGGLLVVVSVVPRHGRAPRWPR